VNFPVDLTLLGFLLGSALCLDCRLAPFLLAKSCLCRPYLDLLENLGQPFLEAPALAISPPRLAPPEGVALSAEEIELQLAVGIPS
jgi:hypothetical protein